MGVCVCGCEPLYVVETIKIVSSAWHRFSRRWNILMRGGSRPIQFHMKHLHAMKI